MTTTASPQTMQAHSHTCPVTDWSIATGTSHTPPSPPPQWLPSHRPAAPAAAPPPAPAQALRPWASARAARPAPGCGKQRGRGEGGGGGAGGGNKLLAGWPQRTQLVLGKAAVNTRALGPLKPQQNHHHVICFHWTPCRFHWTPSQASPAAHLRRPGSGSLSRSSASATCGHTGHTSVPSVCAIISNQIGGRVGGDLVCARAQAKMTV